jgi:predicted nucleic acid-binding protein
MATSVFVDANVFVYAQQPDESLKHALAVEWIEQLWRQDIGRTSFQALAECYSVLTRKVKPRLAPDAAWSHVAKFIAWNPQPVNAEVTVRARDIEQRYGLNWSDCLIVSAAEAQGCSILLTEDLQQGATYGDVQVQNPFVTEVRDPHLPVALGSATHRAVWQRLHRRPRVPKRPPLSPAWRELRVNAPKIGPARSEWEMRAPPTKTHVGL